MKRRYILLLFLVLLFLLRGPLYRRVVHYEIVGQRPAMPVGGLTEITDSLYNISPSPEIYARSAQRFVASRMRFTARNGSQSPAGLLESRHGNCVGYARLLTSLLNAKLPEYGDYRSEHGIAEMSFLGINIHRYISSPFFRDHDVVLLKWGAETLMVLDPSLYDYLWIGHVSH